MRVSNLKNLRAEFNNIPKIKSSMAICASRALGKKASRARRRRARLLAVQEIAKSEPSVHKEKEETQKEYKFCGEKMGTMGDFNLLPEDCFAHVISFTSPRHACILSLLSSSFRSAVDSDVTWERFLPSDYASLLSRAVQPVQYASKKELYLRLCDHPVQIDGGKLSFGLKKSTGAKCFTIPACKMNMPVYKGIKYWKLISLSNSRFPKGAKLIYRITGGHTQISGSIDSKNLSSHTIYAPHLIFRTTEAVELEEMSFLLSTVTISGLSECKQRVFLRPPCNPTEFSQHKCHLHLHETGNHKLDVKWPKKRTDGWMEVEMGQFYNENWEDREVEITLRVTHGFLSSGIDFLGVEFRPKMAVGTVRPWMRA
ncbi:F-box protein [Rhynchospora pubera]|uniref:F-box protein n=2 Tax=Rhynchospora pubera TaxID=906938 RepID=A0AAV8H3E5_9POAL|nr:F-box protein [Rhynchospora pubera]